jgi:hypothetical protein
MDACASQLVAVLGQGDSVSLTETVIDMVHQRGAASADELLPELEEYTLQQVSKALDRGRQAKLIESEGYRRGGLNSLGHPTSRPSRYRVTALYLERIKPKPAPRPAASVWDLAKQAPVVTSWPPAFEGGRAFKLLTDEA